MAEKQSEQDTTAQEQEAQTADFEQGPEAAAEGPVLVPQEMVDDIIRKRVYGALALGLAPIPLVDLAGLFAIQVELVRRLAKEHEVPFKANLARSLIASLVGGVLPVAAAPLFSSLIKFVPVIGTTTGAVSMSIMGAAATYGVGKVFAKHFATGGSLVDFKTDKMREYFNQKFREGKNVASNMKQEAADQA